MKEIPIGVDNGFGNTKGCNSIIQSGVRKLPTKPPLETHVVLSTTESIMQSAVRRWTYKNLKLKMNIRSCLQWQS